MTISFVFIADVRPPGSPHWQAVQDLLAERLEEHGYEVVLDDYGTGINVLGRRLGTTSPEETVVIGAHYDHIEDCAGADDNASGVAAALEMARVLAQVDLERTVLFGFWDEEELGLIGSAAWVSAAVVGAEDVIIDFTFDTIGFTSDEPDSQQVRDGFFGAFPEAYDEVEANDFRGDFIAIVTSQPAIEHAEALVSAANRIGLPEQLLAIPDGLEDSVAFGGGGSPPRAAPSRPGPREVRSFRTPRSRGSPAGPEVRSLRISAACAARAVATTDRSNLPGPGTGSRRAAEDLPSATPQ